MQQKKQKCKVWYWLQLHVCTKQRQRDGDTRAATRAERLARQRWSTCQGGVASPRHGRQATRPCSRERSMEHGREGFLDQNAKWQSMVARGVVVGFSKNLTNTRNFFRSRGVNETQNVELSGFCSGGATTPTGPPLLKSIGVCSCCARRRLP